MIDWLILLFPSMFAAGFLIVPEILISSLTNCHGAGSHFRCPTPTGYAVWIWSAAFDSALILLAWTGYFAVFNGLVDGRMAGNAATGIAVRDATTGAVIGIGRGALRWLVRLLLYALAIVPGILNDLWPLWDEQKQTLADKAVSSVMIRTR